MLAKYDVKNPSSVKELAASAAILGPFSQEIMMVCYEAALFTYAEINASNESFKKIYDSQLAFKKEVHLWTQLPDHTFDTFMMRQQRANNL